MVEPYYQDEFCTIYNADCRDVLPQLERVDLVLTDPPYGIGISNKDLGGGRSTGIASTKMIYGRWDSERTHSSLITAIREMSLAQIIWGGNYYADVLPASMGWLVWYKREGLNQRSFADCELAWTSFNKAARVFNHRWDGFITDSKEAKNGHPTQKPVALMKWCIKQAGEVATILDPFMGSGTSLVAARSLGLKAIGIEINEAYCQIAVERLRQGTLFDAMNQVQERESLRQVSMLDSVAAIANR